MRLVLPLLVSFSLSLAGCGAPNQDPGGDRKENPQDGDDEPDPEPCEYPEFGALTGVGDVMPIVSWSAAYMPDGSLTEFSLEDFHCGSAWEGYSSATLILVAEWCPNCPDYLAFMETIAVDLEAAGSLLVIVDVQTRDYEPPTSESSDNYVTSKIGTGVGVRVGEADADPAGLIYNATIWSAVPSGFTVRKSDMQVVVNQDDWQTFVVWPQVARHLDADWSDPNNAPFFSNCAEGDEESLEPNDLPTEPAALAPGVLQGGICTSDPDFFTVDIAGDWRVELAHDPLVGDLDIYAVEPGTYNPIEQNNAYVGSATIDPVESFTFSGPATLMVYGYLSSSAPYTLTLTEL